MLGEAENAVRFGMTLLDRGGQKPLPNTHSFVWIPMAACGAPWASSGQNCKALSWLPTLLPTFSFITSVKTVDIWARWTIVGLTFNLHFEEHLNGSEIIILLQ